MGREEVKLSAVAFAGMHEKEEEKKLKDNVTQTDSAFSRADGAGSEKKTNQSKSTDGMITTIVTELY